MNKEVHKETSKQFSLSVNSVRRWMTIQIQCWILPQCITMVAAPEHMDISESSIDSVSETTIQTTAFSTFTIAHNALRIAENASTPEVSGNTIYTIDDPTSFANRPCIDDDHMTQQDIDTIVIPKLIEESFQESIAPMDFASSDELAEFQVIEESSQRGKKKLVDSKGYIYTVKRESAKSVLWRCPVQSKKCVRMYNII